MIRKDAYLWLKSIEGVSDLVIKSIEENNVKIEEIIDLSDSSINKLKNINSNIKKNIVKYKSHVYLDELKYKLNKSNIEYICIEDKEYPKNLKNIYNPPKVLFYKGNIGIINNNLSVAMVGARKCTQYGSSCAQAIGKKLSENNINIISGLAIGIDYYSHIGCLQGNSKAIGVIGSSLDNILPKANLKLSEKILSNGGVILSEYNIGTKVYPSNYVHRNRIISGISDGVLVVEAAKKSGALITVDYALDQGKNVFAIPGNINSLMSEGCHNIIKLGAKLVNNIEDILEEYEIENVINKNNNFRFNYEELNEKGKVIIESIKNKGSLNIDEICDNTKIDIKYVNSILNELIIKDIIIESENEKYSLNI